jgi:hypothetical protein
MSDPVVHPPVEGQEPLPLDVTPACARNGCDAVAEPGRRYCRPCGHVMTLVAFTRGASE